MCTPGRNDLKFGTVVVLDTVSQSTDFRFKTSRVKGIGTPVEKNIQSVDLFFPVRLMVSLVVY